MAEEPKIILGDYSMPLPTMDEIQGSIVAPPADAHGFSIKPDLISLISTSYQFGGLPSEDPEMHLYNFLLVCNTFQYEELSEDAVRLRLFPFSLRGNAAHWLRSLPARSITTWDQLFTKFLVKYSPPSKLGKLRKDIATFVQFESESLYEAWERFQDLLRRCPCHGLPEWQLAHIFFEGLSIANRSVLGGHSGDFIMNNPAQAYDFIQEMVSNNYWQLDRHVMETHEKQSGVLAGDTNIAISKQLEILTEKVESLTTLVKSRDGKMDGPLKMSGSGQQGQPICPAM